MAERLAVFIVKRQRIVFDFAVSAFQRNQASLAIGQEFRQSIGRQGRRGRLRGKRGGNDHERHNEKAARGAHGRARSVKFCPESSRAADQVSLSSVPRARTIASAIRVTWRSTSSAESASTITRATGSVPEYRTTTRPRSPSSLRQAASALPTPGTASSGGFSRTRAFWVCCGERFRPQTILAEPRPVSRMV